MQEPIAAVAQSNGMQTSCGMSDWSVGKRATIATQRVKVLERREKVKRQGEEQVVKWSHTLGHLPHACTVYAQTVAKGTKGSSAVMHLEKVRTAKRGQENMQR